MAKIWKYVIPPYGTYNFDLNIPEGAKILSLQLQQGEPCMWAWVEEEKPKIKRYFIKVSTGDDIGIFYDVDERKLNFIGTYQKMGGVSHVFEILQTE